MTTTEWNVHYHGYMYPNKDPNNFDNQTFVVPPGIILRFPAKCGGSLSISYGGYFKDVEPLLHDVYEFHEGNIMENLYLGAGYEEVQNPKRTWSLVHKVRNGRNGKEEIDAYPFDFADIPYQEDTIILRLSTMVQEIKQKFPGETHILNMMTCRSHKNGFSMTRCVTKSDDYTVPKTVT